MTIRVSTTSLKACIPSSACTDLLLPSKPKGLVTTPTVNAPSSCATFARIGEAPVPVPPPSPAAINTLLEKVEELVQVPHQFLRM